jgi:PAS domain S-box-containing protein
VAATLRIVGLTLLTSMLMVGGGLLLFVHDPWMRLLYLSISGTGIAAALLLRRLGRLRAGSTVLVLTLFGAITGGVISVGNIYTPATVGYLIVVLASGLLLGTRAAVASAAACCAVLAVLGQVQDPNSLQSLVRTHSPASIWWVQATALATAAALICVAIRLTRDALADAERSEAVLAARNRELESEIAARRLAESEQRASERRYRALVRHSDDIICEIAQGGAVLYANPRFERTFGIPPEALADRSLIHPEDRPLAREFLRRLSHTRMAMSDPIRLITADGTWRWFEATASSFSPASGVDRAVAVCRDVTERQADADRIRESEARFRALAENTHEVIAEFDSTGTLTFVSPHVETLTGRSRETLLSSDPFASVHPDDLKLLCREVEGIFDSPRLISLELRYKHASGDWRQFEVSAQSFETASGSRRIVVVARDITERRELERQLRASQKLEAVARLAGGVAHDFNNLLTVVTGHVDLLLRREVIPDDERESLAQVQQTALRAGDLVEQLLAFSRTSSGELRVLDMNEVVRDMERLLRRLIGEQVDLEVRTSEQPLPIRFDRSQLEQILANLSLNARDALPGYGRLVIETSPGNPLLGQRLNSVVLSVSDTGVGMDAETRERIFEPFFTTKASGMGTGLGLSTVHGIVEGAGGTIDVSTAPGAGSRFTISLPRADEPVEIAPERGDAADRVDETGQTILLVEDEMAVRRLVQRVLRSRGYQLLEAADGKQALDIASAHPGRIDLLLSDLIMPVMGGLELAERLTATRPGVPVLFMTGYREHARLRGWNGDEPDVISKPFRPDELAARVRAALARSGG